ncbi:MAG: amino acid ABC transporter ATP-binding protein [Planctomycetota bacterium]|nr:amino acid ABC transporter ATP-binding protein [Planctomycetota bacterium]
MANEASPSGLGIRVNGLVKRYGDREVLRGVDLEIVAGHTVALIGPSGGGKTTLLRCLNGLESFDGGTVHVGEHALSAPVQGRSLSPAKAPMGDQASQVAAIRRSVGMIFQDFQLFPHLSVLENITAAAIWVLGENPTTARENGMVLLERVRLADFAHRRPGQLSGGQKQRVAIARALALRPRGLLCDEITSALDPETKHEVLAVLEDLKREGLTVVMVTHEIGFARRAADRVVLLAEGAVTEEGTAEQVLDRPRTERASRFLARVMG